MKITTTRIASIAATLVLLLGAISGVVSLGMILTGSVAAASSATPVSEQDMSSQTGAAETFASLFIDAWLRGQETGAYAASPIPPPSTRFVVERAVAVQSTSRDSALFNVVVAAELIRVLEGTEQTVEQLPIRHYGVAVYIDPESGATTVLGPPSVVARPRLAVPPEKLVAALEPTHFHDAAITEPLNGFFAAFLTGTSNVELFTRPDSKIIAVTPAVYNQVELLELGLSPVPGAGDNQIQIARVVLRGTEDLGSQVIEYHVVLAERDGRWEISQVLDTPYLIYTDSLGET